MSSYADGHYGRGGGGNNGNYDNRPRGRDRYPGNGGNYGRGDFERDRSRDHRGPGNAPGSVMVEANLFKVIFHREGAQTFYKYHLQMNYSHRPLLKNEEGQPMKDENGRRLYGEREIGKSIFDDRDLSKDTPEAQRKQERRNRSSPLSERVIRGLQHALREQGSSFQFVSDGSRSAYSIHKLEGLTEEPDTRPARKKRSNQNKSQAGIYGPADQGGSAPDPEQSPIIKPWRIFDPIRVRRECDDEEAKDDPDAHKRKNFVWIQVKMTLVGKVEATVNQEGKVEEALNDQDASLGQAINLCMNNAMLGHMMALQRGPKFFYFKEDLFSHLTRQWGFDPQSMPVYGMLQSARKTADGSYRILADLGLGWKRPEFDRNGPIPILDPARGTLANVPLGRGNIRDALSEEVPHGMRREVATALSKLTFHIKYTVGEEWINMMMTKPIRGMDDTTSDADKRKELSKRAKRVFRNKKMMKPVDGNPETSIRWAADDPEIYSFDYDYKGKDGQFEGLRPTTVYEYFLRRHFIRLKYPKMPLVQIGQKEFLPVELLFQAQGAAKIMQKADQVTRFALSFNDEFSCGKRIRAITDLYMRPDMLGNDSQGPIGKLLRSVGMSLDPAPLKLEAKALKPPKLVFANNQVVSNRDGSWSLQERRQDVGFHKSATLHSFAVVNMSGDRDNESLPRVDEVLPAKLFGALSRHGVDTPLISNGADAEWWWKKVEVAMHPSNPEFREGFISAKERARRAFMDETLEHNLFFHTLALIDNGNGEKVCKEVAVFPPDLVTTQFTIPNGMYGVLEFEHMRNEKASHYADIEGRSVDAWLWYQTEDLKCVCAFNVQMKGGRVHIWWNNSWQPVNGRLTPVFKDEHKRILPRDRVQLQQDIMLDGVERRVGHLVDLQSIECPSIVFVILPQKSGSTDTYYKSKLMSYLELGVNSQVIVMESFTKQKRKEQYCSNIALKLNTKLATLKGKQCAWSWERCHENGTPDKARQWLDETPTLVIGLAKSSGQGQGAKMIVVGTAYVAVGGQMFCFESRAQAKSAVIDPTIVKRIVKNLVVQFYRCNGVPPERIVVVRSGEHDGLFKEIIEKEIRGIRQGYLEAKPGQNECEHCGGEVGCHHCCPLITFLVAQGGGSTRHNIKLVPQRGSNNGGKPNPNVPSGTCVDGEQLLMPTNLEVKHHEDQMRENSAGMDMYHATSERTSDFFLVAHGGLKGTSNGVYYRVILNENRVFRKQDSMNPLDRETLQQLIFSLSFIYGKATKSPRDSALIKCSELLANIIHGMIGHMDRDQESRFLERWMTDDNVEAFGDSLLPAFGPYASDIIDEEQQIRLKDAFRPHTLS